jgi:hypothetical protein
MEKWSGVLGYERTYKVSSDGRVMKIATGLILKPWVGGGGGGYYKLDLSDGDKRSRRFVHHLVLEAFVGPRPVGCECRHLDGNSRNNALANLAWGTAAENMVDKVLHGTWVPKRPKTPCMHSGPRRKLTEKKFAQLLADRAAGVTQKALAKKYRISKSTVEAICQGRCRHRGEPPVRRGYRRSTYYTNFARNGGFRDREKNNTNTCTTDTSAEGHPS